jgi:hypothetical protein
VAEDPSYLSSASSLASPSSPTATVAVAFFAHANKVSGSNGDMLGGRDSGSGSGSGGFMSEVREMRDRSNDRMMHAERRAFGSSAEIITEGGATAAVITTIITAGLERQRLCRRPWRRVASTRTLAVVILCSPVQYQAKAGPT